MIELFIYLATTLVSWILLAGGFCAYYQNRFKLSSEWEQDLLESISLSMGFAAIWPIGLLVCYYLTEGFKYGWSLQPYKHSKEE